jgi:hypothetical protein
MPYGMTDGQAVLGEGKTTELRKFLHKTHSNYRFVQLSVTMALCS